MTFRRAPAESQVASTRQKWGYFELAWFCHLFPRLLSTHVDRMLLSSHHGLLQNFNNHRHTLQFRGSNFLCIHRLTTQEPFSTFCSFKGIYLHEADPSNGTSADSLGLDFIDAAFEVTYTEDHC